MATLKNPLSYLEFLNYRNNPNDSSNALSEYSKSQSIVPSNNGYQATYLFDFTQKRYEHISGNCSAIYGYINAYFKDGGLDSYIDKWDKVEFEIYNKLIFPDFLKVLNTVPKAKIENIVCSRNYHFTTRGGEIKNLLQRSLFIMEPKSDLPVATFGTVSDITHFSRNEGVTLTIEYLNPTPNFAAELLFQKTYFKDLRFTEISKRELEVLKWIADGLSSKLIAEKLNLSINTVSNHRKNMLYKTNSKNSVELINYALALKLL